MRPGASEKEMFSLTKIPFKTRTYSVDHGAFGK